MTNIFITSDIVAKEALISTEDRLVFAQSINRGFAQEWSGTGVGDSIRIKKIAEITAKEHDGNSNIVFEDIKQSSVSLLIEKWFTVPYKITSKQMKLELKDIRTEIVDPAMKAISKSIELYALSQIKKVSNFAEYVSGVPSNAKDVAELESQAVNQGFPANEPIFYIMNSRTKSALITSDTGMYDASARQDGGKAFESAQFGKILGISGLVSTLLPVKAPSTATDGGYTTSPILKSKFETPIVLDGMTSGETITEGDILTFLNSDGSVVKASVKTGLIATGTSDILTVFSLNGNVESGATVTVKNVGYGCVYNSNAFTLATLPLDAAIGGADSSYVYDEDNSMGVRVTMNFVDLNNVVIFDVLAGSDLINNDLAFRTDLVG